VFTLAVATPPSERRLSVAGCRILARQFRAWVEAHHTLAVARVGRSLPCPLDLHALLPVPDDVLDRGATHPATLAWMAAHWVTTDRLRLVSERPQALAVAFRPVTAWSAIVSSPPERRRMRRLSALAACWPVLHFALRPIPAD
jgi:hypothetical protein